MDMFDDVGNVVPERLRRVFEARETLDRAAAAIHDVASVLDTLRIMLGSDLLEPATRDRRSLYYHVRSVRPHAVCPACLGTGERIGVFRGSHKCNVCWSAGGWLTMRAYEAWRDEQSGMIERIRAAEKGI